MGWFKWNVKSTQGIFLLLNKFAYASIVCVVWFINPLRLPYVRWWFWWVIRSLFIDRFKTMSGTRTKLLSNLFFFLLSVPPLLHTEVLVHERGQIKEIIWSWSFTIWRLVLCLFIANLRPIYSCFENHVRLKDVLQVPTVNNRKEFFLYNFTVIYCRWQSPHDCVGFLHLCVTLRDVKPRARLRPSNREAHDVRILRYLLFHLKRISNEKIICIYIYIYI